MKSTYVIQADEKSFCRNCGKPVDLLCEENTLRRPKPWFYICWACKAVAEVGKGPVYRDGVRISKPPFNPGDRVRWAHLSGMVRECHGFEVGVLFDGADPNRTERLASQLGLTWVREEDLKKEGE